jgi:hypothetical protein
LSWFRKLLGGAPTPAPAEPPKRLQPILSVQLPPGEPRQLYGDQLARKQFMEGLLSNEGVRVNPHLPAIESEAEVTLRTPEEVAGRLLALAIVAVKGEGLDQETIDAIVEERGVLPLFSPRERRFIAEDSPSEHDRLQFSWRYEAAWVLFWALGWDESPVLGLPRAICDVPRLAGAVRDTPDLAARGLRSTNDILNEADLIYRCHWAVRQASIDGEMPSGGLEPGVTMERHHALNWLIRYDDAEWDEVSTDT